MSFQPKHLVGLTDDDLADLTELLRKANRDFPDELMGKLTIMPLVTEDGKLSERGENAAIRIAEGLSISSDHFGAEELRKALREASLADAYLEISLQTESPGEKRSAIVARHMAAQEQLRGAAIVYLEARLREGNKKCGS